MSKIKMAQYSTVNSRRTDVRGYACGMGYLFLLSDNTLIAIDGGNKEDGENFLALMREMTGQARPRVRMWIITHPHDDHYSALLEILKLDAVEIDAYYSRVPDDSFGLPAEQDLPRLIKDYGTKNITARMGDSFAFGELHIDTLITCREVLIYEYERTKKDINNLSLVFKITVGGQSILFVGDAGTPEYEVLKKLASSTLKSDIYQVSHHGVTGAAHNDEFTSLVSPTVALWPGSRPQIAWRTEQGSNKWIYSKESSVKLHIVAGDGNFITELPYNC